MTATTADSTSVEPEPEPSLSEDDYDLTVKTLSKQCFGSAGCSVTVRVTLAASERAQEVPAELTIIVSGDEDGAVVETITLDGSGQYTPPEIDLDTPRSSTVVKARITGVEVS